MPSAISWTDETWNPVTGCSKVDGDCMHCYAERISLKFGRSDFPWTAQHAKDNVHQHPDRLDKPRKFQPGTRVFVNSMSDLFHELVSDRFILDVFDVMASLPRLTFQILSKRPARLADFSRRLVAVETIGERYPRHVLGLPSSSPDVLPNVWLGTSIGSKKGLHRLWELRQAEAAVKWLSIEPLTEDLGELDLFGIDWVAVGGESGQGFRPMDHAWARRIRDQALEQKVAFFFKQSAAYRTETGTALEHGDGSRWEWRQMPGELVPPVRISPAP